MNFNRNPRLASRLQYRKHSSNGREQQLRTLLVVNARMDPDEHIKIAAGYAPRKDYLELQSRLNADVVNLDSIVQRTWTRWLARITGNSIAQSLLVWTRLGRYDVIFVDREATGFLIAALMIFRHRKPRLFMIGHLLSRASKVILFRGLRLGRMTTQMVVHSTNQLAVALQALRLKPGQVVLLPYQVDERFWLPGPPTCKRQICSVGLEFRDYDTLIKAVDDMDVEVHIAAASNWSNHSAGSHGQMPPNVHLRAHGSYVDLRRLYAESLFVVVPLHDVSNQAGITSILEAMAMGKAVVVSHTRGQTDVIRDRRSRSRFDPKRETQAPWIRDLGADDSIAAEHTGLYVKPGDHNELRRAITYLLENPKEAHRMGANGRKVVEATMTLDSFVQRISDLVAGDQDLTLASSQTYLMETEAVGSSGLA